MPKFNKSQRQLIAELERRQQAMSLTERQVVEAPELGFEKHLTAWQHNVIKDPSKRILLCMGRRSGKSVCAAVMALRIVRRRKDARVFFIYPSRERAKKIMWGTLKGICDAYRLPVRYNESELFARFTQTDSEIHLVSVEDVYHADKMRGHSGDLYIIDEAQSFRDQVLTYMIAECIGPAAKDLDAPIVLAGTPSDTTSDYWYKADVRNNPTTTWSCYTASVLDNQYYHPSWRYRSDWKQLADALLAEVRAENGWSESNPQYLREWLAHWQTGGSKFYYSGFGASRNVIQASNVPPNLKYIIGGDFGHRVDPTVLVVAAYNEQLNRNCYVVESVKLEPERGETTLENICDAIADLDERYKPDDIVGDYAGGGSWIFEEVHKRYGIYVRDAQKKKKSAITEIINSELFEGRVLVSDTVPDLIREMQTVRWDSKHKGPDPRDPNDTCDAFQYAATELLNYLWKEKPPKVSEKDRIEQEIASYWEEYDRQQDEQKDMWGIEI